ncbi:MAG: type II methionyl aminopeptidase, partial [Promethearchaeota archaeon]
MLDFHIKGLEDEAIECYLKAGKAVSHALKLSYLLARPGSNLHDLATLLEQDILDNGADGLAFPANISLNEYAAHYSPTIADPNVLPAHGMLKVDLGGLYDGYVADAAVTINLGNDGDVYSDLVNSVKDALYKAISMAKPGVNITHIGAAIQREIRKYNNLKPISNLGGHGVGRWELHGSPFIPNVAETFEEYILKEGDQIAIEPFATNGYGEVRNGKELTIFEVKNIHKKKNLPQLERLTLQQFKKKFKNLPFSPRWIDFIPKNEIDSHILKYYRQGILDGYHVFEERAKGLVAQHEHTLLITKDGAVPTTWWEDFDFH